MAHWWNDNDKEETAVLGHGAILFTTDPTRTPLGLIPCLCGEKPVTDCLIYYTVCNVNQDGRADDYIYVFLMSQQDAAGVNMNRMQTQNINA
jgi:hypothetical protein